MTEGLNIGARTYEQDTDWTSSLAVWLHALTPHSQRRQTPFSFPQDFVFRSALRRMPLAFQQPAEFTFQTLPACPLELHKNLIAWGFSKGGFGQQS